MKQIQVQEQIKIKDQFKNIAVTNFQNQKSVFFAGAAALDGLFASMEAEGE